MNIIFVYILAFLGGIFLAIQAGFNTQLGTLLKQPILAVIATSMSSLIFGSLYMLYILKDYKAPESYKNIPWYLWFIGGLFSVIGISLYFYTIPKLGISKMITLGLCGQLIFAIIAGNYGWLNLPIEPLSVKRLLGVLSLLIGIFLINTK